VKGLGLVEDLDSETPTLDTPTTAATFFSSSDQVLSPETTWRIGRFSSPESDTAPSRSVSFSSDATSDSYPPETTYLPSLELFPAEVASVQQSTRSKVITKAYGMPQLKQPTQYVDDVDPMKRMVQVFSAKLVLEVFGGAGAIWGFSEVCFLRSTDTQEFWRTNACVFGVIFAVRWLMQIRDYMTQVGGSKISLDEGSAKRLAQIFSAKMVLEVFGGSGAIWGFSEVVTLRRTETLEFWRYNACVFALIFFIRWCLQVREYMLEHGMTNTYKVCITAPEIQLNTEKTALTSQENSNSYGV